MKLLVAAVLSCSAIAHATPAAQRIDDEPAPRREQREYLPAPTSYEAAEPPSPKPRGLVTFGVTGGSSPAGGVTLGVLLDGGARLGSTPFYAHGALEAGSFPLSGTYTAFRLGLAVRTCNEAVCVFAGADAGRREANIAPYTFDGPTMHEAATHAMVVARTGIDIGGGSIRGRFAFEMPMLREVGDARHANGYLHHDGIGGAVTFGLAVAM